MLTIEIPVGAVGPGSQPGEDDGAALEYVNMPKGMTSYEAPLLPEPEELSGLGAGLDILHRLQCLLKSYAVGEASLVIDLSGLDQDNRELLDETLGEGEVSILHRGSGVACIQETRLAGVWRVQYPCDSGGSPRDQIEVADIPSLVRTSAFSGARDRVGFHQPPPEGVLNAPPVLVELIDKARGYRSGDEAHVINLTLLPQTEEDIAYLDQRLGTGPVSILSRGYGNCRITATGLSRVWWVQHFNSEEKLILNTLEVVDVPSAALAAQEDIADSAERLGEILEALG